MKWLVILEQKEANIEEKSTAIGKKGDSMWDVWHVDQVW